ncbi:MAG TPA: N-acetylmuramoyl-L-alanine amidase [Thermoanaerobaculia bacterium]|nr:N-acetylmuramoyl-L-alanine amidase [Thermoanaerobaculia bacterium]
MRAEKTNRVRRRLLEAAVADNLETIRGLPPRALRRPYRIWSGWMRRLPVILVPLTLAAWTWLATSGGHPAGAPAVRPAVLQAAVAPLSESAFAAPTATLAYDVFPEPLQRVRSAAFPLSVRRVVLDAGHGGTDPGTTTTGLAEKEITLDIGQRLAQLLEASGFEVVRTRDDDETVPLRDRTRLANDSRGDIFVSIHVNALLKHRSSRGIETYYLGPTNDPSLTQLAASENSSSGYSLADLRDLLDGVYADARRDESRQLAASVQQHLYTRLRESDPGLENWGVKSAPFLVLVATDMPAILAEVGCLSNQKEAALLRTGEHRQQIAEALFHGIHAYAAANGAPQKKGT